MRRETRAQRNVRDMLPAFISARARAGLKLPCSVFAEHYRQHKYLPHSDRKLTRSCSLILRLVLFLTLAAVDSVSALRLFEDFCCRRVVEFIDRFVVAHRIIFIFGFRLALVFL